MGPVSSQGVVVRSKSWMVLPAGEEGIESENHRMVLVRYGNFNTNLKLGPHVPSIYGRSAVECGG